MINPRDYVDDLDDVDDDYDLEEESWLWDEY